MRGDNSSGRRMVVSVHSDNSLLLMKSPATTLKRLDRFVEKTMAQLSEVTLLKADEGARLLRIGKKEFQARFKPVRLGPKTFRYRLGELEEYITRRQLK